MFHNGRLMRHTIVLSLSLAVFWLANTEHFTFLMLSLGGISILLVIFIAHRMDVVDHEAQPVHFTVKIFSYYGWLIKEIVISNLLVVKHIWLGNASISPVFKTITANQKTEIGKVIYANSITLTPGTVTVNIDGDKFLVHSLLRESIEDLESGEMNRRVTQLEN